VFSFASEKAIGQTITLTAPSYVCSNSNYDIRVTSSLANTYVMLVYSINNGPWVVDITSGLRLTTPLAGGGYYFT
jgi:hypothetical protein